MRRPTVNAQCWVLALWIFPLLLGVTKAQTCDEQLNLFSLDIGLKMPYYTGSVDLSSRNPLVLTLIVVLHGTSRDAPGYYCDVQTAVNQTLGNKIDSIFVFAPYFTIEGDLDEPDVIYWDANNDWKAGDQSTVNYNEQMSSYAVLDEMLLYILKSKIFPNLINIIITGNSAGGQVTHRYAMTSPYIDPYASTYGVKFSFFPLNPSSFVYMDMYRPNVTRHICNYCNPQQIMNTTSVQWITPKNTCGDLYNQWKYGLDGPANQYIDQTTTEQKIKQYLSREVTYIAGLKDICNNNLKSPDCDCDDDTLDRTCEAMTQGNCRLQRSRMFYFHVMKLSNGEAPHNYVTVPGVGHGAGGMYNAPETREALFAGIIPKINYQ